MQKKNYPRQFLTCCALLAVTAVPAHGQTARRLPATDAIDAIFKRYDGNRTPGCSVAVIDGGKALFKKSYGMADPALGVAFSSSTTSWIPYSEARVFVGLALAMLARDGKITLDEPVRRYVPELPAYARAVTVRQLLHHTSGLADYGTLAGPGFELPDRLSEDEFFRILTRWSKLGFAPGSSETYSNSDYALLKILIERVSGASFHDYLSEKLLRPNGMTATRIGFDQSQVVPGHALFHEADGDGFRRLLRYRISPVGTISVTTSLDDLVRLDRALRDPRQGLSAMLKQLENGAPPPGQGASDVGYSFGVHRAAMGGLPMLKYRGVGDFTYLVQFPTTGVSVATLCNAYRGMDTFALDVARLYLAPAATVPDPSNPGNKPADVASVPTSTTVVTPAELLTYVGHYQNAESSASVDVTVADGRMVITPRGRPANRALQPLGAGKFQTLLGGNPYTLQFKRVDGEMVLTSWDVVANEPGGPTLRRTAMLQPTADTLRTYSGVYVGENVEVTLHVREYDGRLLLASSGFAESELRPRKKPDEFRLPDIYTARFERDATGQVISLILDASRVKGMRFKRAN